MTVEGSTRRFIINGSVIFFICFVLVHLFVVSQAYWLAKDLVHGDGSYKNILIPLRYPPMRVPSTPITIQYAAEGRLSADFAQIYFPALNRNVVGSAYAIGTTLDPWSRESKYPPLVHFICSRTLSLLPYGPASLAHLVVQYVLFLASLVYVSFRLSLKKYLLPMILLLNASLFLTPVGLSWMERGQFSLYVAMCYLWLMFALITRKKRFVVAAALFGFAKWTSFPFVFVATLVYLVNGRTWNEFKSRLLVPAVFCGMTMLLFIMFFTEGIFFLKAIFTQEATYRPLGITLTRIFPLSVVKALPFFLVAVSGVERFSIRRDFSYLLPFLAGAAILLVTYPTFAFDYSVPCIAAFIPLIAYWAHLPGISKMLGSAVQGLFLIFMLLASWSVYLFFNSEVAVVAVYAIIAVCLAVASFLGDMSQQRNSAAAH